MSRTGAILCAFYAIIILVCVGLAWSSGGDYKGQFVFLQLPIALQISGLNEIGISPLLKDLSWLSVYLWIGLPTFLFLYSIGWLIDRVFIVIGRSGKSES